MRLRRYARLGSSAFLVVDQQVVDRDAILEIDDFGIEPVQADALVAILAEDHRLAVLEIQNVVGLDALVGGVLEHAVVEDVAVLVDLDERRALVG